MASVSAGAVLERTIYSACSLGFVPVAIRFRVFEILAKAWGGPLSSEAVLNLYRKQTKPGDPEPPLVLIEDTLLAMAGLGFVNRVKEDMYQANEVTKHIEATPSAKHGSLLFTTEGLLASAFLMRKLEASNFQYPFDEMDNPLHYAYSSIGRADLAEQNFWSIMEANGRLTNVNGFMDGKFGTVLPTPENLQAHGYDIQAVLNEADSISIPRTMVDIGGGKGQMLLQLQAAFPQLQETDLIVQDFNPGIASIPGITLQKWDFKGEDNPQPVKGALVYHLQNLMHDLPDLEAARLLQKIAEAMAPYSRVLIHGLPKNVNMAGAHAAMILFFGGRQRGQKDWEQMAAVAGLRVTFQVYPEFGEGVVEMRKV
ncbi:O-methyltransferase [Aspergillus costaricaensis CBS 115574]|uniref:O-methyltransferase n=1 Tax=Aspergillus costaricaensis CBS 115574 TaxID=1448317 RepID=A0ACD1IKW9_9EURO|nr:O-methyltransferase [Aspergillus costaricaensis CBS 115574]RAK90755.1 O-methyltransferase [Aspergillus costaricaensis CBS 115574]